MITIQGVNFSSEGLSSLTSCCLTLILNSASFVSWMFVTQGLPVLGFQDRTMRKKLLEHARNHLMCVHQLYTAATNNPKFDHMEGNPICIQIPWDRNPEVLAKWMEGKTRIPWIDAIMTQLRQEGWIHHLARHAVACFLTRGDLWISWKSGVRVFDELLLDADFSVNSGNWMWLSCSAFFQQFFHCYCPVGFGQRTDPSDDYVQRYLPKLKGFPSCYIYEPWNAPESVQKATNCVIGVDYPKPMVNHAESSRLNIERMKQIYQQLSRYRGLCLLASVPSCMEDLSSPVADPSSSQGNCTSTTSRQNHCGQTSPKRKHDVVQERNEELYKRARVMTSQLAVNSRQELVHHEMGN